MSGRRERVKWVCERERDQKLEGEEQGQRMMKGEHGE